MKFVLCYLSLILIQPFGGLFVLNIQPLTTNKEISQITGTVYDFYFHKHASGQWNMWTDYITKEEMTISPTAKVTIYF